MRSMSNRIFVDSSVLIEYYKGANTSFLEALFAGTEIRLFINQIVVSEYLYQCPTWKPTKPPCENLIITSPNGKKTIRRPCL